MKTTPLNKVKKIICYFRKHTRGYYEGVQFGKGKVSWTIWCKRCDYKIMYQSPRVRLIGTEMRFGFDGE